MTPETPKVEGEKKTCTQRRTFNVKRPPFVSRINQMVVIDYLCTCGGKWSGHEHDIRRAEPHGGGHSSTGCRRFRFAGYMYEQAKIEQEAIRPETEAPAKVTEAHHVG